MRLLRCSSLILLVAGARLAVAQQDTSVRRAVQGVPAAMKRQLDTTALFEQRAIEAPGPTVTKTFKLAYLKPYTAQDLIKLYYGRYLPTIAVDQALGVITVRATVSDMAQIEKVIADYDHPAAAVTLSFDLIAADTVPSNEPALASLEATLRSVLRFPGYRLLGQALGNVNEGSTFQGTIMEGRNAPPLLLTAQVVRIQQNGGTTSADLDVHLVHRITSSTANGVRNDDEPLTSAEITVPIGQTVILGTAAGGPGGVLILTVRPELVSRPGGRE